MLWPKIYPALGVKVGSLGPILGISGFVSTITLPLWGWAADRFSRKSLLIWITGFWGAWTAVIAFAQPLTQLLFMRVLVSLSVLEALSLSFETKPTSLRHFGGGCEDSDEMR